MTDRNITDLAPSMQILAQQFLDDCEAAHLNVKIIQTYRSTAEQDALYQQGRTMPGKIVTHAQGGQSPHECVNADGTPGSRAIDFGVFTAAGQYVTDGTDPRYRQVGEIGKKLGLDYGGDWPEPKTDHDHLEMPGWQNYMPSA